jgi:4-amino-4-deoxy-L-arabinose transferase-like glycosyltransferase
MKEAARIRIAFLVLIAIFLGMGIVWLRMDRSPPSWDDAFYLTKSLVLFDALTNGGVPGYARSFMTVMGTKPPLIAALPTPLYLLFGRRPRAAYLVNIAALFITLSALYGLGRRYSGPRAGLFALYIAGTMPMIYGLSHWFLVECGLIAIVCVAMYLLGEME